DPQNMSFSLRNGPGLPNDRAAFVQYINIDLVVPNPTTVQLIAAANRAALPPTTTVPVDTFVFNPSTTDLEPPSRHPLFLNIQHMPPPTRRSSHLRGWLTPDMFISTRLLPP